MCHVLINRRMSKGPYPNIRASIHTQLLKNDIRHRNNSTRVWFPFDCFDHFPDTIHTYGYAFHHGLPELWPGSKLSCAIFVWCGHFHSTSRFDFRFRHRNLCPLRSSKASLRAFWSAAFLDSDVLWLSTVSSWISLDVLFACVHNPRKPATCRYASPPGHLAALSHVGLPCRLENGVHHRCTKPSYCYLISSGNVMLIFDTRVFLLILHITPWCLNSFKRITRQTQP